MPIKWLHGRRSRQGSDTFEIKNVTKTASTFWCAYNVRDPDYEFAWVLKDKEDGMWYGCLRLTLVEDFLGPFKSLKEGKEVLLNMYPFALRNKVEVNERDTTMLE